jgi:LuxR family maltose regulon positive regulatory protein
VVGARIAVALHRHALTQAESLLQNWPFADTLDDRIRRLLAGAAIAIAGERRPEAVEQIDQALIAAEPDGYLRVFLDAPERVRALTSMLLQRSPAASQWRADLSDRLNRVRVEHVAGSPVPMTRRERAVLEHLTTSLTHAQIAAQLFVSDNTLKSHCRNLYRKLGVNSRGDAVRIARAQGWLAPVDVVDLESSPGGDPVSDLNITHDLAVVERAASESIRREREV